MLKFLIDGFKINAAYTIISRITGFIRDIFFAYYLGAGFHSDIFFIASKIPNLFRRITAEGALTSSFLPIYSKMINSKNKKLLAQQFAKLIFFLLFVLLIVVTIILEIFMEELVLLIAPGFKDNKILFDQIVILSRFTILFLPIISVVSLFGAMLNSIGRFAPFAFLPTILNLSLILSCLFISDNIKIKALPLAFALPISGLIQFSVILYYSFKYRLVSKDFFNFITLKTKTIIKVLDDLKLTLKRFLPALLSGGVFQINILVDTLLASFLGIGSVSFLYYADRLVQLPLGVVGVALGITLISSLSRPEILKSKTKTSIQFEKAIKISIYFSIPAMLVFLCYPEIIIDSLYKRGNFGTFESEQTILALVCYAFGIPFFVISKSCQAVFLASGKTVIILLISILQLLLNIILSLVLMQYLAHGGIALATSISTFVGCVFYLKFIVKEKKLRIGKFTSHLNEGLMYLFKYSIIITFISFLMIAFLKVLINFFIFINFNINLVYALFFSFIGISIYIIFTYIMNQIPFELSRKLDED